MVCRNIREERATFGAYLYIASRELRAPEQFLKFLLVRELAASTSECEAAIREVREETGIELAADSMEELGRMAYMPRKDLHLFRVVLHTRDCNIAACRCTSFFPHHASGVMTPEVDQFRWVDMADVPALAAKSMTALLRTLPGFEAMPPA